MRKFWLCVLTIFGSSIFSSCEAQTKLPKELPRGAEITYISEGGLLPNFFSIVISGNKMKVTDQSAEKQRVEWEAKLSGDEVKNLYLIFVENKFDAIRPNQDMRVADGKSRSIELKFGGKRFYAVKGDGIETSKESGERFDKIEDAFSKLVKKYEKKGA